MTRSRAAAANNSDCSSSECQRYHKGKRSETEIQEGIEHGTPAGPGPQASVVYANVIRRELVPVVSL